MKKSFLSIVVTGTFLLLNLSIATAQNKTNEVHVSLDLVTINNDRVAVTIIPPKIKTSETTFYLPKIVPGTYSEDDYGRYIDNFKAYDAKGNELTVAKMDENSWLIKDSKKLAKVTYLVNDTYENVTVRFAEDKVFLDYATPYMKWSEELIALSDDELVLKNKEKKEYHYKKTGSINLLDDGKTTK